LLQVKLQVLRFIHI